ncbi:PAS domain-containing protein [Ferrovibrio xuzhouensis]|uniref:PAS domain-containing protein n=1 Tax=Ferrovibrio xuzhouensis TaxID=1576914 RepID=A0ABV7VIA7_9PROT
MSQIESILQTVHAPMLRAFVTHWYAQRGANLVTRRADFETFRFAPLLPHIFLYDYDSRTRNLTLRLAGEEIRRMLPNSVAGTPLDRIMPARALPEVLARYRRVCEQPAIGLAAGRVFLSLGGSGVGERLLLPLADANGRVHQMLGATLYQIGETPEAGGTFASEDVETIFFPLQKPSEAE